MKKQSILLGIASLTAVLYSFSGIAAAHVVVKPAEVLTAGFQTYSVGVPNEKDIPTTSVKLVMPDGLKYVSVTNKPGWEVTIEKQGSGEAATVKSITWQGGTIAEGFRDDFTFAAQAPDKVTDLQWKAYQTYSDGTVVSWDKADTGGDHDSEDANSGPYSVTKVVNEISGVSTTEHGHASGDNNSDRALAVSAVAALLGLVAIYLATRRK